MRVLSFLRFVRHRVFQHVSRLEPASRFGTTVLNKQFKKQSLRFQRDTLPTFELHRFQVTLNEDTHSEPAAVTATMLHAFWRPTGSHATSVVITALKARQTTANAYAAQLISGHPGIGKTRAVEELLNRLRMNE